MNPAPGMTELLRGLLKLYGPESLTEREYWWFVEKSFEEMLERRH